MPRPLQDFELKNFDTLQTKVLDLRTFIRGLGESPKLAEALESLEDCARNAEAFIKGP